MTDEYKAFRQHVRSLSYAEQKQYLSSKGNIVLIPAHIRFATKYEWDLNSGCWIWNSTLGTDGYGGFWNGKTQVFAHRASWELHRGKIPDNLNVCHKCDTPLCVNPDHLFLGTQKNNHDDMMRKGRHPSSPHWRANHA